ncbi:hypothetical protein E2C01_043686 [Portunus trituberculatus]|uniref:Uncharacterized protein n=1 Tax=Portunus trituberculatus TaxID=210409 RepID=A0A5B7FQX1_PORTR|nr:hypothetical protein [Portunus trituberculatus]
MRGSVCLPCVDWLDVVRGDWPQAPVGPPVSQQCHSGCGKGLGYGQAARDGASVRDSNLCSPWCSHLLTCFFRYSFLVQRRERLDMASFVKLGRTGALSYWGERERLRRVTLITL